MDFHSGKTRRYILVLMCGAVQTSMPLALTVIMCVNPHAQAEDVPLGLQVQ